MDIPDENVPMHLEQSGFRTIGQKYDDELSHHYSRDTPAS
jgi:hypothetical protein